MPSLPRHTAAPHRFDKLQTALLALLIVAGVAGGPDAAAQADAHRTLQIQEGTVYIDGRAVEPDALPSELALDGVRLQYQVYGMRTPVIRIQGRSYRLTESTLEPVASGGSEDDTSRDARGQQEPAAASAEYMQMLRAQNQVLYEAVQREYALEHAAEQRAYRIRQLPPGPERTAHFDTLRQTVTRLFDLKQANRRRELEQLEQRLDEMRQRIRERAAHREAMIEQRIRHLTSQAP
jgi:hypothetical protein